MSDDISGIQHVLARMRAEKAAKDFAELDVQTGSAVLRKGFSGLAVRATA
jgi:hypothetical protein